MWPSSLFAQLLLSALLGVLAAGVAAALALGVLVHLRDVDDLVGLEIEDELDKIEQGIRIGTDGRLHLMPLSTLDVYDALRRDTAFRVIDPEGRTVLGSLDGPAVRALAAMAPGTRAMEIQDGGMSVLLQVRERRIARAGAVHMLQVAWSNRFAERMAKYSRGLYLGSTVASVSVALAVFALVICVTLRRVMVPLRRASAIATSIGPRTLSARLHVDGVPLEMLPLIDALNSALERVEKGFKVQQEFLAMAAHELKTPLTLLQAEIEVGGDVDRPAILRETQLMARQVSQLLHLAEVSEGHNYRFSKLSPWKLALDAANYLQRLAERNGVSLHVECLGAEALIDADEGAAFVLLKNLLENAINHSPNGGRVVLEASVDGFSVLDEGPGVEVADHEHLFKRFWRGSGGVEGAGLGLAIVSEICLAHHWQVRFEDPGRGARFVVSIPAVDNRGK